MLFRLAGRKIAAPSGPVFALVQTSLLSTSAPASAAAAAYIPSSFNHDSQIRQKPLLHSAARTTAVEGEGLSLSSSHATTQPPGSGVSPLRRKYGTSSAAQSGSGTFYPSFPDVAASDNNGFVRASSRAYKEAIDEMLRVDHAGETGAVTIYEGQMWMLRGTKAHGEIARMREGEVEHLKTMDRLMAERRVRPTLLLPIWRAAGFALGAGTALLGPEAAMACTVAVETVIGGHYNDQIRSLLMGPGRKQQQQQQQQDWREGEGPAKQTTVGGATMEAVESAGQQEGAEMGEEEEQEEEKEAPYRMTEADKELVAVFKRHRDEELEHLDTGVRWDAEKAPAYGLLTQIIKVGCGAAIEVARRI